MMMALASHGWCQITPLIQSYIMSSGILGPKYRRGHPPVHPKLLQVETPLDTDSRHVFLFTLHPYGRRLAILIDSIVTVSCSQATF